MDEDKVINILNNIGVSGDRVTEEDYNVYADYFAQRSLTSDESDSDEQPEQGSVVSETSLLKNIPQVDDLSVSSLIDINIEDVIIEIEVNGDHQDIVDENDGGEDLVNIDNFNNEIFEIYDRENDLALVNNFLDSGCGCKANCCKLFSANELLQMLYECAELDHYKDHINILDQVILGQLRCLTSDGKLTSDCKKKQQKRKGTWTNYMLKCKSVCKNMFMFGNLIKIKRLKRITKMYNSTGLVAVEHGNAGKLKKNTTSILDTEYIVKIFKQLRRTAGYNTAWSKQYTIPN